MSGPRPNFVRFFVQFRAACRKYTAIFQCRIYRTFYRGRDETESRRKIRAYRHPAFVPLLPEMLADRKGQERGHVRLWRSVLGVRGARTARRAARQPRKTSAKPCNGRTLAAPEQGYRRATLAVERLAARP